MNLLVNLQTFSEYTGILSKYSLFAELADEMQQHFLSSEGVFPALIMMSHLQELNEIFLRVLKDKKTDLSDGQISQLCTKIQKWLIDHRIG